MEGFWPIFFLLVVLKIPVFGALWLVWWASKAPEDEGAAEDSGDGFGRWRPMPKRPRGPHHSPYGGAVVRRRRGAPPPEPAPALWREKQGAAAHKFLRRGTPSPPVKPPA